MSTDSKSLMALKATLNRKKPKWVSRVLVSAIVDHDDEPALQVTFVLKKTKDHMLSDGRELASARRLAHEASGAIAPDMWPYTRYLSHADSLDLAS